MQAPTSPQERVATACQSAEDAFGTGDVNGGCATLLAALRSLDKDNAELVDLTTAPIHLLVFGMCSLMTDESLGGFLDDTLDAQANPIDDALLLFFYVQYKSVAEGRGVPAAPLAEQVVRAQRMEQSTHGLIRAIGLVALSSYAPGGVVGDSTRTSFNHLAELCPEAKSTREVLHRLLLVSAGDNPSQSQGLRDLVNRSDWNPAVQAVMADDPVVDLVREVTAPHAPATTSGRQDGAVAVISKPATTANRTTSSAGVEVAGTDSVSVSSDAADTGIAPVLTAAQDRPEAEVKDWCLRLAHAHAEQASAATTALCTAVQAESEPLAKSGETTTKSISRTIAPVQSLETMRARHMQFSQALKNQDLTAAGQQLDTLLATRSAEEPLDSNTHENILLDAVEYGLRLVGAGEYTKAKSVYERIARKYPNSDVAARCQGHIDHINAVLAIQPK